MTVLVLKNLTEKNFIYLIINISYYLVISILKNFFVILLIYDSNQHKFLSIVIFQEQYRVSIPLTFFWYGGWGFTCGPVCSDWSTSQPLSIHVTDGSLGILNKKQHQKVSQQHRSFTKYLFASFLCSLNLQMN